VSLYVLDSEPFALPFISTWKTALIVRVALSVVYHDKC
jgi:hypothetical protein